MSFISTVLRNIKNRFIMKNAIERAVDECIEKGVMRDFLMNNRREVVDILLTEFKQEFDQEACIRDEKNNTSDEDVTQIEEVKCDRR